MGRSVGAFVNEIHEFRGRACRRERVDVLERRIERVR